MTLPDFFQGLSITRFLQGIAVGAIAAMGVGFIWGGWVTGGTATTMTSAAVEATQVSLYSPVCVDRYAAKATDEQRATFAKEENWNRDSFIEKTGFATPPGATDPIGAVADACAATLSSQLEAASGKS
jgi:hypothetical protein